MSRFTWSQAVDEGDGPGRKQVAPVNVGAGSVSSLVTEFDERCCCTPTWVDKDCIGKVIEDWEYDEVIFCNGCFMNLDSKFAHTCHYYNHAANDWTRMVKRSLLEEDRFNKLLQLYGKRHHIEDIESKRRNIELALRSLVNVFSVQIGELLCQKDRDSYYRLNPRL